MNWIVVLVIILIILLVICAWKKWFNRSEKFSGLAAGSNSNVGMLAPDNYMLSQAPDMAVPTVNFADLVSESKSIEPDYSHYEQLSDGDALVDRIKQLDARQLLPRNAAVTPYNIDVAQPSNFSFMAAPQIQLKPKFASSDLATVIRGDVPITQDPHACIIYNSQYGVDEWRSGLFTPYFTAMYNDYTGNGYKNMVSACAGAGVATGYGGAAGDLIMN